MVALLFVVIPTVQVFLVTVLVGAIHSFVPDVPDVPWQAAFFGLLIVYVARFTVTVEESS